MRITRCFWIAPYLMLLAACSNPRDKVLPVALSSSDADARAIFEQLTPPEQLAITGYEVRRARLLAQGDNTARNPVTYRQAIADEMVYEAGQAQRHAEAEVLVQQREAAEAAKAAATRAEAEADMRALKQTIACQLKAKRISLVPLQGVKSLPSPTATYDIACRNASGEEIRGFKGSLFFNGPYGELVDVTPIRHDSPLASGAIFEERIKKPFVPLELDMSAQIALEIPIEKITIQVKLDSLLLVNGRLIKDKSL